jgi:Zn-dependent protease
MVGFIALSFIPRLDDVDPTLGNNKYLLAVAFAVLLYLSILVHELAHAAVARAQGLRVRSVALSMLGGVTSYERRNMTAGGEFMIAAAGPAATLALALAGWVGLQLFPDPTVAHVILFQLALSNLLVGIYNLLPGLPLDGGAMLADAVWKVTGRELTGQVVASYVGRGVAVLTAASPFLLGAYYGVAPNTFVIVWAGIIAYVLWAGSVQALRVARIRSKMQDFALRDVVRRALGTAAGTPLGEALRQLEVSGAGALVVTDTTGRTTGLVSEAAVSATPVERRPWVAVDAVSRALVPGLVLRADLTGEDLLDALATTPATEYLVVDQQGLVVGVLSTTDAQRLLSGV